MLVTNHVLSGALIGAVVRRPLPAFTLGVASHFALDTVPHWGKFHRRIRGHRAAGTQAFRAGRDGRRRAA
jgi:hypothetical protein